MAGSGEMGLKRAENVVHDDRRPFRSDCFRAASKPLLIAMPRVNFSR